MGCFHSYDYEFNDFLAFVNSLPTTTNFILEEANNSVDCLDLIVTKINSELNFLIQKTNGAQT